MLKASSLVVSAAALLSQASGFSTPNAPAFLGRSALRPTTTTVPTSSSSYSSSRLHVASLVIDDDKTTAGGDDDSILEDLLGDQLVRELCASERYARAAQVAAEKGLDELAEHLELEAEEERMRAACLMEFADRQDIDLDLEEIRENVDEEIASDETSLEWDTKKELCDDLLSAAEEDKAALLEFTEVAEEIVVDEDLTEALTEVLDELQEDQVDFEQGLKEVIAEAVPIPTMKTAMNP